MKHYEPKAIVKLCAAIRGEKDAQDWLKENGCRELSEFWDAYENMEMSFRWLMQNGYPHLAAAVDAMSGNDKPKLWLVKNGFRHLVLFCDASEGNQSAVSMLLKTDYKEWVPVAMEIFEYNKKKSKKGFWGLFDFGNPYK